MAGSVCSLMPSLRLMKTVRCLRLSLAVVKRVNMTQAPIIGGLSHTTKRCKEIDKSGEKMLSLFKGKLLKWRDSKHAPPPLGHLGGSLAHWGEGQPVLL